MGELLRESAGQAGHCPSALHREGLPGRLDIGRAGRFHERGVPHAGTVTNVPREPDNAGTTTRARDSTCLQAASDATIGRVSWSREAHSQRVRR